MTSVRYVCTFLLSFLANVALITCDCYEGTPFAILRTGTEWALSGAMSPNVSIYEYDGSSTQKWLIECASRPGFFHIINRATKERLAATDDIITTDKEDYGYEVELTQANSALRQEWFFHNDGHIFNAALDQQYLQVKFGNLQNGAPVSVWTYEPPQEQHVWTLRVATI